MFMNRYYVLCHQIQDAVGTLSLVTALVFLLLMRNTLKDIAIECCISLAITVKCNILLYIYENKCVCVLYKIITFLQKKFCTQLTEGL